MPRQIGNSDTQLDRFDQNSVLGYKIFKYGECFRIELLNELVIQISRFVFFLSLLAHQFLLELQARLSCSAIFDNWQVFIVFLYTSFDHYFPANMINMILFLRCFQCQLNLKKIHSPHLFLNCIPVIFFISVRI